MYVPFRALGAVSIAGAATIAAPALEQPLGSDSEARRKRLESVLGTKLQFEQPRRRGAEPT